MMFRLNLSISFLVFLLSSYLNFSNAHNIQKRQSIVTATKDCTLEDFPNGNYLIISQYVPGSIKPNEKIVQFSCDKNYELSPSNAVVACINGYWNDTLPVCVPEENINEAKGTENENDVCGYWNNGYQAPWQVAIYRKQGNKNYQYLCGGAIVSSNVIITAAHCFMDGNKKINANDLYVGAGKWRSEYNEPSDWTAQYSQGKKYVLPENYKGAQSDLEGDLGLLILSKPFDIGYYVHSICIDWENKLEAEQLTPGNIGYVQGWGYTNVIQKTPSATLQQLGVPVVERQLCLDTVPRNFQKYITNDKFCAGYTNGSCVCNGDEGGALVFEKTGKAESTYYIQGLVSTFPKTNGHCDKYQYGVYTKISPYRGLIQQVINENKIKKASSNE